MYTCASAAASASASACACVCQFCVFVSFIQNRFLWLGSTHRLQCREVFEQTAVMKQALLMQGKEEAKGIEQLDKEEAERMKAVHAEVERRAKIAAEIQRLDDLKLRAQQGDDEALTEYQQAIKVCSFVACVRC